MAQRKAIASTIFILHSCQPCLASHLPVGGLGLGVGDGCKKKGMADAQSCGNQIVKESLSSRVENLPGLIKPCHDRSWRLHVMMHSPATLCLSENPSMARCPRTSYAPGKMADSDSNHTACGTSWQLVLVRITRSVMEYTCRDGRLLFTVGWCHWDAPCAICSSTKTHSGSHFTPVLL